jgi:hypothetical protein
MPVSFTADGANVPIRLFPRERISRFAYGIGA